MLSLWTGTATLNGTLILVCAAAISYQFGRCNKGLEEAYAWETCTGVFTYSANDNLPASPVRLHLGQVLLFAFCITITANLGSTITYIDPHNLHMIIHEKTSIYLSSLVRLRVIPQGSLCIF